MAEMEPPSARAGAARAGTLLSTGSVNPCPAARVFSPGRQQTLLEIGAWQGVCLVSFIAMITFAGLTFTLFWPAGIDALVTLALLRRRRGYVATDAHGMAIAAGAQSHSLLWSEVHALQRLETARGYHLLITASARTVAPLEGRDEQRIIVPLAGYDERRQLELVRLVVRQAALRPDPAQRGRFIGGRTIHPKAALGGE